MISPPAFRELFIPSLRAQTAYLDYSIHHVDGIGAFNHLPALCDLPRLLFAEPSPAPIKHWLWRAGLIDSPEVRLPMTPVSNGLAARIEREIERLRTEAASAAARVA